MRITRHGAMCLALTCLALGYVSGRLHFNNLLEERMVDAYRLGYAEGRKVDWKVILKTNQKEANRACTAWWFEMDVNDRRLDRRIK